MDNRDKPQANGLRSLDRSSAGPRDRRYLTIALCLILAFMAVEVGAGVAARSLALISDAGHMLADVTALVLSLVAARLSLRPASGSMTYGLRRSEILSAHVNGITLLVVAALLFAEAVHRILTPSPVRGGVVLIVGLAGIVVNLAAAWILAKADRTNLNVEGSFQHVLTDLYGFIATSVAGALIYLTGRLWWLDTAAAAGVAVLMTRSGVQLIRDTVRVFLEAAPKGIDPGAVERMLLEQPEVRAVEDLHIWEITSGFPALSAHLQVTDGIDCHAKRRELDRLLEERFQIRHNTLQIDHTPTP